MVPGELQSPSGKAEEEVDASASGVDDDVAMRDAGGLEPDSHCVRSYRIWSCNKEGLFNINEFPSGQVGSTCTR